MNLAVRFLPPLSVIAAFTIPAVILRPGEAPELQHTICLELPLSRPPPSEVAMSRANLEACLAEWDERGRGDAFVTVHVRIDAMGHARAATFDGPEDALRSCVENAVTFPVYPSGEPREVDVYVEWFDRRLSLSVALAHHHASVEQELDDDAYETRHPHRPSDIEAARAQLRLLQLERAKLLREIELRRRR